MLPRAPHELGRQQLLHGPARRQFLGLNRTELRSAPLMACFFPLALDWFASPELVHREGKNHSRGLGAALTPHHEARIQQEFSQRLLISVGQNRHALADMLKGPLVGHAQGPQHSTKGRSLHCSRQALTHALPEQAGIQHAHAKPRHHASQCFPDHALPIQHLCCI